MIRTIVTFTLLLASLLAAAAGNPMGGQPALGPGRKYSSVERMQTERLRAVHEDRLRIASERHDVRLRSGLTDYRAILHAHAEDSAHTAGTRPELLAAARQAGVKIIMLSDHVRPERDFIDDSWRGLREGVLFIPGAESEGFLAYPIASVRNQKWDSRERYIGLIREGGGNIFLSHVEEKLDWPTANLDGLEIYNHHTDIKDETAFSLWLRGALTDPVRLTHLQRSLTDYPQEVFGAQQDYLRSIMSKWDRDAQSHRLTGVAANDCHHNQVFTITTVDASTVEVGYIGSRATSIRVAAGQAAGVADLVRGHKPNDLIARLDLDPYERSLRYVTTHILAERLTEPAVREALKRGHAYVAHDWLCDPTGFVFGVERRGRLHSVMGDEVSLGDRLRLRAEAPVRCTIKLFCNGLEIKTTRSDSLEIEPKTAGVYRVEAWLTLDGEERPWVYSNPIYVR
jgi:hypothetical protein